MKTKTVVELSVLETADALIAKAKESVKPNGGAATVEIKDAQVGKYAVVTFEWGAK